MKRPTIIDPIVKVKEPRVILKAISLNNELKTVCIIVKKLISTSYFNTHFTTQIASIVTKNAPSIKRKYGGKILILAVRNL